MTNQHYLGPARLIYENLSKITTLIRKSEKDIAEKRSIIMEEKKTELTEKINSITEFVKKEEAVLIKNLEIKEMTSRKDMLIPSMNALLDELRKCQQLPQLEHIERIFHSYALAKSYREELLNDAVYINSGIEKDEIMKLYAEIYNLVFTLQEKYIFLWIEHFGADFVASQSRNYNPFLSNSNVKLKIGK